MKFLVLGASGMAGHTISTYLQEKSHDVTGFDKAGVSHCRSIVGDACDNSLIRAIVQEGNYDIVINCIGILNQFAEQNKTLAICLNSYLPHLLAEITADMTTRVFHMSTDCVFSGKRGGYTEQDNPDGETYYDKTKALGELNDNKNLTLRNSIIGPDLNKNGIGLLNWFMQQAGPLKGYTHALWTGLTTLELAKIMEYAAKVGATGLYNMVHEEPISKYDLLQLFNKYLRGGAVSIAAETNYVSDKSLKRTRFDFDYIVPDYDIMVYELSEWIKAHKHNYPHYGSL